MGVLRVGRSLLAAILLTRNVYALTWAHTTVAAPTHISLTSTRVVVGPALVVLIMIAGHTSETAIREL